MKKKYNIVTHIINFNNKPSRVATNLSDDEHAHKENYWFSGRILNKLSDSPATVCLNGHAMLRVPSV